MYPTLYHAAKDLLGLELQVLKLLNTFGVLVALAFFAAARCLSSELARKTGQGLFRVEQREVVPPRPPTPVDLAFSGLFAFLFGYKVFAVALGRVGLDGGSDTQGFLLSAEGHLPAGIVSAVVWVGYRYYQGRRLAAEPGEPTLVEGTAADHTLSITGAAALGGLIGAKVFHLLERPESILELVRNPSMSALFSGLTIYGGLIVGALAVYRYCRRASLPFSHVCDAVAPGLMLAYGIGRIGCQLAGDGDWGIVSHGAPAGFGWLPEWLWAFDYPNNVLGSGSPMAEGGFSGYGTHLVPPVYPTPLYESLAAFALFGLLWWLRLRVKRPLMLFGAYLVVNGFERFWIEKIRVNATYDIAGWAVTQAELISTGMFIAGLVLIVRQSRRAPEVPAASSPR